MGKIRFLLALMIGKTAGFLLRKFTGRGTNTPGVIMQKICPDVLGRFSLPSVVVFVTGTNGKTGTSNLVTHLLRRAGLSVVNNSEGSNMAPGLITALCSAASLNGKVKADAAVLEVDERSSPYIFPHITPTHLLCTNLFRDSIKRNGHSEYIFHKIQDYLPGETTLLLNGNDPISGRLGENVNERVFFSVKKTELSSETCPNITCDCMSCPVCHRPLAYHFYHYHHIGEPQCACGFTMPSSRYTADNVDFAAGTFSFCEQGEEPVLLPFVGGNLFSVFNVTVAAGLCRMLGISMQTIVEGMHDFTSAQGRFEEAAQGERRVVTMLCKNQNPVSASQSFSYLERVQGEKDVVLLITDSKDAVHGHEDISWIYDADFEKLSSARRILIGGTRCYDVALRLTLAGVPEEKLLLFADYAELIRKAPELVAEKGTTVVYFELYAMALAGQVRRAITGEEASR